MLILLLQLVDLLLAQPGRHDIRRRQPAPTGAHVRADPGQGLKPQPAQPADLRVIERRLRPRPVGVQLRAGVGVGGGGVELHGVHQRHRYRRGAPVSDKPSGLIRHNSSESLGRRRAQPAQIVEPDHRIRPSQVDVGVQIAQQPVGQAVGQARSCSLASLTTAPSAASPATTCAQSSPPTVNDTGYLVVNQPTVRDRSTSAASSSCAPVALHIDADRRRAGAQELRARQRRTRSTGCLAPRRETPRAPHPSSMRVVSTSSDTDRCPAVANVSTAGCTAGNAAGVAATCRHASACATTSG